MTDQPQPKRQWKITRRGFLIGLGVTGAAGVGLALGLRQWGLPAARLAIADALENASVPAGFTTDNPFAWIEINPDNTVTLVIPKMEMGQGVHTSLAQIGAEELEVTWDQVRVRPATSRFTGGDGGGTQGSSSVSSMYDPLRLLGATLRETLRAAAATLLAVPAADLVIEAGRIFPADSPDSGLTYAEIVAQFTGEWPIPADPPALKPASQFKLIGQPLPRVDLKAKVTGQAVYGYDARIDGMRYGAVARPPQLGAKLTSAAPGRAATQPGVEQVVIDGDFVGIVAGSRDTARNALNLLDLTWETERVWQQADLEAIVTVGKPGDGVVIQRQGNPRQGFQQAAQTIEAEYRTPFALHAPLEAQSALADVRDGQVTIWAPTQSTTLTAGQIAEALGIPEDSIEVIPTYLGGGFGRKVYIEAAVEAARLSAAVGAPVHVGWSRNEEMRFDLVRPATHHVFRGGLDSAGRIVAWEHKQASADVLFSVFPGFVANILGADFGAYRGGRTNYLAIPHIETIAWRTPTPVPTFSWRGLGLMPNNFATESFIDELAALAGADPVQFRLDHLDDAEPINARLRGVLQRAADLAGWGGALPAGHAHGVAITADVATVVAQIAEVSVESNNQIRVHNITAVMDCGTIINPDGAKAQVQGNVIWGVGSALLEQVTVVNGVFSASNYDAYPLLTTLQAPNITVDLFPQTDAVHGVGEPAIGPVPAAIANAVYALTGQRLRSLPLRLT